MGVIKKSTFSSSITDSIEDVLEDIQHEEQDQQVPEIRRPRKIKHRSARPQAIGGYSTTNAKSGKKKKRVDNSNYLLSLAEPEEAQELSIQDFIPQTVSVFSKMFAHKDNLEIWNEFINCTQDNEEWFKRNITVQESEDQDNAVEKSKHDLRSNHPAYIASTCFQRIDGDLRIMLKKKHVPLGTLMYLEQELVTFFVNRPTSIYHCHIASSFERLLVHALSQYMDLSSLSYNRNGSRWTRVRNKHTSFCLPAILLSTYLERRYSHHAP
ncbi:R3H domain-containing protein 4 [Araneus ventricosus]|uniref:R3H domain-containing protein 4 n=1 Tax=Araneus ventricosus TaxID=182803 RepID=A0A4Y2K0U4_ARAVE|nr:R3H domain-containing protein 4 [Araneus ventricosus]